ncbi:hypothetical protein L1785_19985, partial [Antribacter sp. KLBMP9083]
VTTVPVNPTVTQAACPAGELIAPTLTLPPDGNGITYTVSPAGPYTAGQTVTVTATLSAGFAWGTLPAGWVEVSPTVATFSVTFDDVECKEVVPVNPTVTQAACPAGELIAPTLTLPANTEAITYTVAPAGPYTAGQTVTVTATLSAGFAWGTLPAGWVEVSPTVATFSVTFDNVVCIVVSPQSPVLKPSVCPPGATVPTPSVLTVGTTTGITYTAGPAGPYSAGQTVTITATLQAGFAWGTLPTGWTQVSATVATFKVTFGPDAVCPKPAQPAPPAAPILPVTGADGTGVLIGLSTLSLLTGLVMAAWGHRRRQLR